MEEKQRQVIRRSFWYVIDSIHQKFVLDAEKWGKRRSIHKQLHVQILICENKGAKTNQKGNITHSYQLHKAFVIYNFEDKRATVGTVSLNFFFSVYLSYIQFMIMHAVPGTKRKKWKVDKQTQFEHVKRSLCVCLRF